MLTVTACGELFHTATGTAFADLLVDGHRETWPIRSKRFGGWLRRRYYEATGGALNGQANSSEVDLLEARAQFDAPERSVHIRIAEHDGYIYLDLADEQWRAVENRTRRLAGEQISAGALSAPGWHIAAAGSGARGVDRRPLAAP